MFRLFSTYVLNFSAKTGYVSTVFDLFFDLLDRNRVCFYFVLDLFSTTELRSQNCTSLTFKVETQIDDLDPGIKEHVNSFLLLLNYYVTVIYLQWVYIDPV